MRTLLLFWSRSPRLKQWATSNAVARRMSQRFIAGEKLADAVAVSKELAKLGIYSTLDHVGEDITCREEAEKAACIMEEALDVIGQEKVPANCSLKLSQIGLRLDPALCESLYHRILDRAARIGIFLRVDMEDSAVTSRTLDLVQTARRKGYLHTGVVLQSYLYRTEQDASDCAAAGIPVRLCKGAYREPASVAFPAKSEVDAAYDRAARILIEASVRHSPAGDAGKFPPLAALATHDPARIAAAEAVMEEKGAGNDRVEFQMLHGIRRDLQTALVSRRRKVRVYVPFGTEWYPYFMRRLAERPANVWFFARHLMQK